MSYDDIPTLLLSHLRLSLLQRKAYLGIQQLYTVLILYILLNNEPPNDGDV